MGKRWVIVFMVLFCLFVPLASPGSSIPTLDITPLEEDPSACGRYKFQVTVAGSQMYYAPPNLQNVPPLCIAGGYIGIYDGLNHLFCVRPYYLTRPPYAGCDPQDTSWYSINLDTPNYNACWVYAYEIWNLGINSWPHPSCPVIGDCYAVLQQAFNDINSLHGGGGGAHFDTGREDLSVDFTPSAGVQILSESVTVNPPMTENGGYRTETRVYEISVPYADTFTVNAEIFYNQGGGSPGPTRSESATSPSGGAVCGADNSMGSSCASGEINSSVNYGSGDYFDSVPLIRIPSPGPSIDLTLFYNSIDSAPSPLSRGWRHPYMTSVSPPAGGMVTHTEEDGRWIVFVESTPPGTYLPRPEYGRTGSVLRRYTDNTSTLTRPDGTMYDFDSAGSLSRITDRRNKSLTITSSGTDTLVTDAFGRTVRLVHDASGKLLNVVDPLDNVTTMLYDIPTGTQLIGIRDAVGRVRSWSYDPSGRIASRTDVDNTTHWYFHDSSGRLDNVVDALGTIVAKISYSPGDNTVNHLRADGGVTTMQYDPLLDMPVRVVDPLDNVTTYEYFPDRNLKKVVSPGENGATRETSYTYDANGYRETMTDANGNTTHYQHNAFGQLEWTRDSDLRETSWSYDPATGNLLTVTAPDNAVTTYRYEDPGNTWKLTSVVRPGPNGPAVTTFGYDPWGNVSSVTDPMNNTSFTYDALGNVLSRTDPAGGTTFFAYDNISRLKTVTDALGRLSRYDYDDATGFITFTDNVGNSTRTLLDAKGNPHYLEDALGNGTWYEYTYGGCSSCGSTGGELLYSITDAKNRKTFFDYDLNGNPATTTDPLGHTTSIAYHPSGDVRYRTDALLRQTAYGHDPLGNLSRITDARGGITWLEYTPGGLLDNVVDASGNLTHYGYDAAGRVSQVASPDAGTSGYLYFPEGSVYTRTDARNVTATYGYDDASRLTGISYPDASRNVTFAYDNLSVSYGKGRLTNMTDPSGTTAYRYDAMGRIVQEDRTVLGVSYSTQYGYDAAGNLTTVTYPGGRVVATTPNGIRRPTVVTTVVNGLPATLAYAFVYDNVADRRSVTLGNGIAETNDFDAVHRPTSIAWGGLAGLTLGYDNVGNVTSMTDNTSAAAPAPFWWTTYDYVGNRLDNVIDSSLRHYLYDENGNTTDDGMRTFIYNQNQRLLQVKQGSTVLVENEYDGKGRRVVKRANDGATVTVFHYDLSDRLIAETDQTGNLKVEYIYLEGRPLAQIRHTGSSEAAYYYHDDHLGTPKMMTDGTGTVVWRVERDP